MLTVVAYGLRVIGAESSAIFAHDTQLVRQSLELGQRLLGNQSQDPTLQTGTKYPLTFTLLLTGVFGATFVTGQLIGAFNSVSAFRDYLFTNREAIYFISVLALNLVSICLIPALYHAQRGLKKAHTGWLAAGIAAFDLLLVHFGHQPRPHVPFATMAFCATVLLVLVANRVGVWKVLLIATLLSALTVGALQSGVLIIVPYSLALMSRLFYDGRFHWRELAGISTIASVAVIAALCIALYPGFVGEYGSVILGYLSGSSSKFRLGAGSHSFSLAMFNIENISQFAYRLRSYEPVLLLLLPLSFAYFVVVLRRRVKLLLVGTSFPLLNLVI